VLGGLTIGLLISYSVYVTKIIEVIAIIIRSTFLDHPVDDCKNEMI